jgi:hypothetical protein
VTRSADDHADHDAAHTARTSHSSGTRGTPQEDDAGGEEEEDDDEEEEDDDEEEEVDAEVVAEGA